MDQQNVPQNVPQKAQKSIYWKITIILSYIIAVGILGAIIWAVASTFIFGKVKPSYVVWIDLIVKFVVAILGIWYGVKHIAKKSILVAEEATKIAGWVIALPVIFPIGVVLYQYFVIIPKLPSVGWFIQNIVWIVMFFIATKYFVKKLASPSV